MFGEFESTQLNEKMKAEVRDISISVLDNGFVVSVRGNSFSKSFVVQSESDSPEEIEHALDVVRDFYYGIKEEKSDGHEDTSITRARRSC